MWPASCKAGIGHQEAATHSKPVANASHSTSELYSVKGDIKNFFNGAERSYEYPCNNCAKSFVTKRVLDIHFLDKYVDKDKKKISHVIFALKLISRRRP